MTVSEKKATSLEKLCDLISVQRNPKDVPDAIYLGLEHLTSGRMRQVSAGRAGETQSHKFAFQKNDVLYGKLRPYLDKAIIADSDGVCTTELLVFRAKPGVNPRYLACVVHAPNFIEYAMTGVTGAHHPRTSWNHISQFEFPYYSSEDQNSIAALLWRIHDLLIACQEAIQGGDELKQSAMRELFTKGLRGEAQKQTDIGPVPESWDAVTINDIALNTQYGMSMRGQPQGRFPILRMNCQDDGRVIFRDLQYVDLNEKDFSAFCLNDGDLLFNRTNSIEHVGRMAIFEGEKDAVFASYLVRLTVDEKRCLPHFLNYYMNRRDVQIDIKRLASRAVGQANINATKLRTIAFPLPPTLDEQREIVAILSAIDRKIDLHRQKRKVLEELFQSLLHKLMTGEIRVSELDLSAFARGEAA